MESSYLKCLRSQGCQGRFGLRLPDCWDYTLTHCTDVHYARKEQTVPTGEGEGSGGGPEDGPQGAIQQVEESAADEERRFRKVSIVTEEGE